ncbi:efflux RND transporter permease subunit [Methanolacinia paynteri]|uniref:efflux RND transporter permease subunit n=1 Tax=Methanolacinia paynteri TaxID=230356 RepID=UPI00064E3708|nr:hydrophobe/amphiphile efflux-3 (HAE3) family transporter [Methanolacinia paynteri]
MKPAFGLLADAINRHPGIIAGILVAVILVSLTGLQNLNFKSTGYDTFVWEDSQDGRNIENYNELFGSETIILIVNGDDILSTENLRYIDTLVSDLENENSVESISGITGILKAYNNGRIPSSKAETDRILEQIPEDYRELFLRSQMTTLLTVTYEGDLTDKEEAKALDNIESVIENSDPPTGISVKISGEPAYNRDLQSEIQKEMKTLIAATLALMFFSIVFLFSYVRYRMLPVAIIAIGILVTFGVIGLLDMPISMPVIGSFPVIIGLGIDYGIQFHSRFNDEIEDKTVREAVYATLTKSGPVHLVAMCTTCLGFLALLSSSIPMIAQFGTACTIGVIASFFTALIIVPLTFRITGYKPKTAKETESAFMEKYSRSLGKFAWRIAENPVPVILIFLSAAVIGIQLDDKVHTNIDTNTFVPQDMSAKIDLDNVKEIVGETSTFTVMIEGDRLTSHEVLSWIDEFGRYADNTHEEITGVESPATLVKKYNDGVIPETDYEIDLLLQNIPENEKAAVIEGGMTAVIEFETRELSVPEKSDLVSQLRTDIRWLDPPAGISAYPTGMSQISGDLVDELGITKNQMTTLGFMMILIFLVLVYRRFSSLLPVIPVAMILGWNTLVMYIMNIEYTPLTACLGSMTVGLAIDYTILIMERFEEEMEKGEEFFAAIETGVRKMGSAITISGATTLLGFSTLILSDFNIIKMFGETTVLTIFFSLVGGIVLMPAIISLLYRRCRAADKWLYGIFGKKKVSLGK